MTFDATIDRSLFPRFNQVANIRKLIENGTIKTKNRDSGTMKKARLIYVTSALSSFVRVDLNFLSLSYDVRVNHYPWQKKWMVPLLMIRQFAFFTVNAFSCRAIVVSSGGYWSIVPAICGQLFSIPVFIILNGSDCAAIPELSYGNLRKPLLKKVTGKSLRYAGMLLPVSDSLVYTENTYFNREQPIILGFRHFFPEVKTNYRVIHNGLDGDFWQPPPGISKEPDTFVSVFSPSQFLLKGGDLILSMAAKFPECRFYMAGVQAPAGLTDPPPNVFFLGRLNAAELRELYSKGRFHFQLSVFEGFGCTLCEAMLCQCIPIGSEVNMIPEIIGGSGFILKNREADLLEQLINTARATANKDELGRQARTRILERYPVENRARLFAEALGQFIR